MAVPAFDEDDSGRVRDVLHLAAAPPDDLLALCSKEGTSCLRVLQSMASAGLTSAVVRVLSHVLDRETPVVHADDAAELLIAALCARGCVKDAIEWFHTHRSGAAGAQTAKALVQCLGARALGVPLFRVVASVQSGPLHGDVLPWPLLCALGAAFASVGNVPALDGVLHLLASNETTSHCLAITALSRLGLPALATAAFTALVSGPVGLVLPPLALADCMTALCLGGSAPAVVAWFADLVGVLAGGARPACAGVPVVRAGLAAVAEVAAVGSSVWTTERLHDLLNSLWSVLDTGTGAVVWTPSLRHARVRALVALGARDGVSALLPSLLSSAEESVEGVNTAIVALSALGRDGEWRSLWARASSAEVSSACAVNVHTVLAVLRALGASGDVRGLPAAASALATHRLQPDAAVLHTIASYCDALEGGWDVAARAFAAALDGAEAFACGSATALRALVHAKCGRVDTALALLGEATRLQDRVGGVVSGEALHARALAVTMLLEQLCVKGRPHAYALDALTSFLDTLRATAARLQDAVAPGSPLLSAAGLAAGPLVDGPRLTAIVLRAARAVMVCQLSQGALEGALRTVDALAAFLTEQGGSGGSAVRVAAVGDAPTGPAGAACSALTALAGALVCVHSFQAGPEVVVGKLEALKVVPTPDLYAVVVNLALAKGCHSSLGSLTARMFACVKGPGALSAFRQTDAVVAAQLRAASVVGVGAVVWALWTEYREFHEQDDASWRPPFPLYNALLASVAACMSRAQQRPLSFSTAGATVIPQAPSTTTAATWLDVTDNLREVRGVVCEMAEAGVPPDTDTLIAICRVYRAAGLVHEARRLLRLCLRSIIGPDVSHGWFTEEEARDAAGDAKWTELVPGSSSGDGTGAGGLSPGSGSGGSRALDSAGCVAGGGLVLTSPHPAVGAVVDVSEDATTFRTQWLASPAANRLLEALGSLDLPRDAAALTDAIATSRHHLPRETVRAALASHALCLSTRSASGLHALLCDERWPNRSSSVAVGALGAVSGARSGLSALSTAMDPDAMSCPWGAPALTTVNGNELCDTLTIGIGAGVEGSLLVVALCGVGDIATAVLQLEDMLVAGVCPFPEAVTSVLEACSTLDGSIAVSSLLQRLAAWVPRLVSLGWHLRDCDVAALVRAYGRAGLTRVAEAITWVHLDGCGVEAPVGGEDRLACCPVDLGALFKEGVETVRAWGIHSSPRPAVAPGVPQSVDVSVFNSLLWAYTIAPPFSYTATGSWSVSSKSVAAVHAALLSTRTLPDGVTMELLEQVPRLVQRRAFSADVVSAAKAVQWVGRVMDSDVPLAQSLRAITTGEVALPMGTMSLLLHRLACIREFPDVTAPVFAGTPAPRRLPARVSASLLASVGAFGVALPSKPSLDSWCQYLPLVRGHALPAKECLALPAHVSPPDTPAMEELNQAVGAADIDAAAVKLGVRSRGRPATLGELEQDVSSYSSELKDLEATIAERQTQLHEAITVREEASSMRLRAAEEMRTISSLEDGPGGGESLQRHMRVMLTQYKDVLETIRTHEQAKTSQLASSPQMRDAFLAFAGSERRLAEQDSQAWTTILDAEKRLAAIEQTLVAEGADGTPVRPHRLTLRGFTGVAVHSPSHPGLVPLQTDRLLRQLRRKTEAMRVAQQNSMESLSYAIDDVLARMAASVNQTKERQLEAFSSQLAAVMQDWKEVVDGEAWSRGALATAQAMADTAVAQRKDLIATAAAYKRRGVEGVEAAQVLARQRQQDAQRTAIDRIVAEERQKCMAGVQDALAATERALAGVESETRVKLHMVEDMLAASLHRDLSALSAGERQRAEALRARKDTLLRRLHELTGVETVVAVEGPHTVTLKRANSGASAEGDLRVRLAEHYYQHPDHLQSSDVMDLIDTVPSVLPDTLCKGFLFDVHATLLEEVDALAPAAPPSAPATTEAAESESPHRASRRVHTSGLPPPVYSPGTVRSKPRSGGAAAGPTSPSGAGGGGAGGGVSSAAAILHAARESIRRMRGPRRASPSGRGGDGGGEVTTPSPTTRTAGTARVGVGPTGSPQAALLTYYNRMGPGTGGPAAGAAGSSPALGGASPVGRGGDAASASAGRRRAAPPNLAAVATTPVARALSPPSSARARPLGDAASAGHSRSPLKGRPGFAPSSPVRLSASPGVRGASPGAGRTMSPSPRAGPGSRPQPSPAASSGNSGRTPARRA